MDSSTKQKVRDYTPEILRHLEQGTRPIEEQDAIVIFRAIEILGQVVSYPESTAYEIAERINLSPQTIFQYLGGLEDGGVPLIRRSSTVASKETGRKETTFALRIVVQNS